MHLLKVTFVFCLQDDVEFKLNLPLEVDANMHLFDGEKGNADFTCNQGGLQLGKFSRLKSQAGILLDFASMIIRSVENYMQSSSTRLASSQVLTLPILKANSFQKHKNANIFENHLNPVMLVLVG